MVQLKSSAPQSEYEPLGLCLLRCASGSTVGGVAFVAEMMEFAVNPQTDFNDAEPSACGGPLVEITPQGFAAASRHSYWEHAEVVRVFVEFQVAVRTLSPAGW